jgi:hypothetical protein
MINPATGNFTGVVDCNWCGVTGFQMPNTGTATNPSPLGGFQDLIPGPSNFTGRTTELCGVIDKCWCSLCGPPPTPQPTPQPSPAPDNPPFRVAPPPKDNVDETVRSIYNWNSGNQTPISCTGCGCGGYSNRGYPNQLGYLASLANLQQPPSTTAQLPNLGTGTTPPATAPPPTTPAPTTLPAPQRGTFQELAGLWNPGGT